MQSEPITPQQYADVIERFLLIIDGLLLAIAARNRFLFFPLSRRLDRRIRAAREEIARNIAEARRRAAAAAAALDALTAEAPAPEPEPQPQPEPVAASPAPPAQAASKPDHHTAKPRAAQPSIEPEQEASPADLVTTPACAANDDAPARPTIRTNLPQRAPATGRTAHPHARRPAIVHAPPRHRCFSKAAYQATPLHAQFVTISH